VPKNKENKNKDSWQIAFTAYCARQTWYLIN